MPTVRSACLLFLLANAAIAQATEAAFDKSLAAVHIKMAAGKWDQAVGGIEAILKTHANQLYVQAQSAGIINDYKTSRFYQAYPKPRLKDLLSGKVKSFNPRTGIVKITYDDDWRDWQGKAGGLRIHPMVFAGKYSVTVAGKKYPENGVRIFYDLVTADDDFFTAQFGYDSKQSYILDELGAKVGGLDKTFAKGKSKAKLGEKFTATIIVTEKDIAMRYKRKSALKTRRRRDQMGQIAIFRGKWDTLTIEGKVEPSWHQAVIDAEVAKNRESFKGSFNIKKQLPKWLFEVPDTASTPPKSNSWLPGNGVSGKMNIALSEWANGNPRKALETIATVTNDDGELVTRQFVRASLQLAVGDAEAALATCDKIKAEDRDSLTGMLRAQVFDALGQRKEATTELRLAVKDDPGRFACYEALIVQLLRANKHEEAARVIRDGKIKHGLWKELKSLDTLLAMAERGPQFARKFSAKSKHYEVVSDIDARTCGEACQLLEQSYLSLKNRFAKIKDGKKIQRFKVFLFAGEGGYQDYCEAILGSAKPHTAGLYSPVLKQLLIWNLPRREDMDRTIRHEGFHQYLDRLMANPPTWLNEGTAEYWETAKREKSTITGGQVRKDHIATLIRSRKALPNLKDFAYGNRSDFYANAQQRYAQAWALVHFLRESNRDNLKCYEKLWQGLSTVGSTRAAMDAAFKGVDWGQLQNAFWEHLRSLK